MKGKVGRRKGLRETEGKGGRKEGQGRRREGRAEVKTWEVMEKREGKAKEGKGGMGKVREGREVTERREGKEKIGGKGR